MLNHSEQAFLADGRAQSTIRQGVTLAVFGESSMAATLAAGYFADVVVFGPKTIADRSTYETPHQYATGMRHAWVNGAQVLKDGEHTGATPGRVVRGPGWKPKT
jgi:N-acyl-D-amino-acid deacylase